jgi:phosphoglycerate dehydrogenase-like enzyme
LPGDTETDDVMDRAALEAMKPTACLYNLGRGNAIDTDALVWALESGRISGACLDVTPQEPLPSDSRLWRTPNLCITPHASAIRRDYLDLYFAEVTAPLQGLA